MNPIVAFVVMVIAAGVAYATHMQWRVTREKFKLALFHKRFAVFETARRFIGAMIAGEPVNTSMLAAYDMSVAEARFLFDTQVSEYLLGEIRRNAADLRAVRKSIQRNIDTYDYRAVLDNAPLIERESALLEWFRSQSVVLGDKLERYLRIDEHLV